MFFKSIAELEGCEEYHQHMTEEKVLEKDRQWVEGIKNNGHGCHQGEELKGRTVKPGPGYQSGFIDIYP